MQKLYNLWYFSRLQIFFAAFSLAAGGSSALLHSINWSLIFAIALGTVVLYWMDDLLDSHPGLEPYLLVSGRSYKMLLGLGIGSSAMVCAWLLRKAPAGWLALVCILAVVTLLLCLVRARHRVAMDNTIRWPLFRLVTIASFWSLACIVLPTLYSLPAFSLQLAFALLFVAMQMLIVITLWNEGEQLVCNRTPAIALLERAFSVLVVRESVWGISALTAAMIIAGVLFHLYPWYNLVLLLTVVGNLWCFLRRSRFSSDMRKAGDVVVFSNCFCSWLVVVLYTVRPEVSMTDSLGLQIVEWAGLAALVFLLVGKVVQIIVHAGINPIKAGVGKRGISKWMELLFLAGIGIWVGEIFVYSFHLDFLKLAPVFHRQLIFSPVLQWIGAFLMMAGIAAIFWAYNALGTGWRFGVDAQNPGELVTRGPFRFSRNPIYVGIEIYVLGASLLYGSVVFWIFAVLAPPLLHYQSLQEEKFLENQYGAKYINYRLRVHRYF